MRRGGWHQFGDRSQKLALEQLQNGCGVGTVISTRDLTLDNAVDYAEQYRTHGASVIVDQQFYNPGFSNPKLASYPTNQFRDSVTSLHQISAVQLSALAQALDEVQRQIRADAVLAPAVIYEAGRPDIVDLNARLFATAKTVGDARGVPTYATVVLGQSATSSVTTQAAILGSATSLPADGWYFGYEFGEARVPADQTEVYRFCQAALILACTGKPVLHAFAGLLGILSLSCGCTAAGIGHSQNLWSFTRDRFETPTGPGGGGGDAPPRFFSSALWGTIVYPDEIVLLPAPIQAAVLTHTPFSTPVSAAGTLSWSRWDANKHLVNLICSTVSTMAAVGGHQHCRNETIRILQGAVGLHGRIALSNVTLKDDTNAYQNPWLKAITDLQTKHAADFAYLDLIN